MEEKLNENGNSLPENVTVLETELKEETKEKTSAPKINISSKDFSFLRKNRYDEIRSKFKNVYILQHKKFPEKIVELRASSAVHACNLIHWKPNQVILLETKMVNDEGGSSATSLM